MVSGRVVFETLWLIFEHVRRSNQLLVARSHSFTEMLPPGQVMLAICLSLKYCHILK